MLEQDLINNDERWRSFMAAAQPEKDVPWPWSEGDGKIESLLSLTDAALTTSQLCSGPQGKCLSSKSSVLTDFFSH